MMSFTKSLKYKLRFLYIRMIAPAVINCIFFLLPRKEKTLLLIKTDGIGDYILFRNYLAFLRSSAKYKDHTIYLLTNIANKELAITFDAEFVDGLFWYSDSFFLKWELVRLLYSLQRLRASTIIYTNYSRKFTVDWLIHHIKADKKIAVDGDTVNQSSQLKIKTDKYYSELITVGEKKLHEFELNEQIFEAITNEKCDLVKPVIEKNKLHIVANDSIVVFPGGSESSKRWSPENYNALCKLITNKLKTNIILAGGKDEILIASAVSKGIEPGKISDKAASLTLVELCEVIGGAKLLVSNDTVAVHIAVALNVPVICISKGDLYGRFVPYPKSIYSGVKNILPESFKKGADSYSQFSSSDINDVPVEAVFDRVQQSLTNSYKTIAAS